MKTLAEQLQQAKRAEEQAWSIYEKSCVTQVNRLLEHMGSPKDFTMNDMEEVNEDNKVNNFDSCVVSNKALAYAIVSRYSWVKVCHERWFKALRKYFALKKQIEEASKAL